VRTVAGPDFVLTATEFDLIYADLGLGRIPYPLEVPSTGATMEERAELTAKAYKGLADRGLASRERLDSTVEDLLHLLADPPVSIDAVGHAGKPVRALAAAGERLGILAQITADELWLTEIRPTALAMSIVGVLPDNEAGSMRSLSVPYQALVSATDEDEYETDAFGDPVDEETALVRAGVSGQDAATLMHLAENRCAGGQFGVSSGSLRSKTLVTWFDTNEGRYLMVNKDSWLSIGPADNQRIEHRLADVMSTVAA
jgi:ESX secretion-associated protein EspG